MDCRTCEPTLIDLVHDELATDAAADARAHLSECASCRASFERLVAARRLVAGLELERPPQQVTARLLQLAEARAGELRAEAAPKAAPTFGRRLLDFVARFAMGRQVGMATIMLLIVAVGLWSLPRLRREPVAGGTVVDAESEGEAAPSPGVEPADRLDLKVDPRSRRIRSNDGQEALAEALPATPAPAPTGASAVPEAALAPESAKAAEAKGGDDPLARLDDVDDLLGVKKEDAPAELRQRPSRSLDDLLEGAIRGPSAAEPQALADDEQSVSTGQRSADAPQAFPASPQPVAEQVVAQATPTSAQAPSPARRVKAKRSQASQASGVQTQPARSQASDQLENAYAPGRASATQMQSAASLLEAARAVARARGCAAALPSYERVLAEGPKTAAAGSALIEMAQCKRSLGLVAEAQNLLERAALIPATRDRARVLMDGDVQAAPASSP